MPHPLTWLRGASDPGRDHSAMVGDIISERWGEIISEPVGGIAKC